MKRDLCMIAEQRIGLPAEAGRSDFAVYSACRAPWISPFRPAGRTDASRLEKCGVPPHCLQDRPAYGTIAPERMHCRNSGLCAVFRFPCGPLPLKEAFPHRDALLKAVSRHLQSLFPVRPSGNGAGAWRRVCFAEVFSAFRRVFAGGFPAGGTPA